MSRRNLSSLFRKWAFNPRRINRRSTATLMLLEAVEDRIAPATLPTPTVVSPTASTASTALALQNPSAANGNTAIDYLNPQVVADPTNALHQVLVATKATTVGGVTTFSALAAASTDGGASWSAGGGALSAGGFSYGNVVSPAVAIGRDGTVYYTYLSESTDKTRGAVLFTSTPFGGTPGTPTLLYQWYNADQAANPAIAVDNNLQSFTDPTTGTTYTDTMATRTTGRQAVYVAWNGNASNSARDSGNFNPNPIMGAVSGDNGATWSNPTPVSDGGYLAAATGRAFAPQIAISPGTSGAPGSLVFVWPQVAGTNYSQVAYETSRPDGGNASVYLPQAYTTTGTFVNNPVAPNSGQVQDAVAAVSPATVDGSSSKTFSYTVPAGTIPVANTGFSLKDLSIDLAVVAPFLDQLEIDLIAPSGAKLVLLNNHTTGDGSAAVQPAGQPFATGISSGLPTYTPSAPKPAVAGLGIIAGSANTFTVFSDSGARRINDPNSAYPYIGVFRPETSPGYTTATNSIQAFLAAAGLTGANAAAINGTTWQIKITDFRNDRLTLNSNPYTADEYLQTFGLTFSSVNNNFGTDSAVTSAKMPAIGTDFNASPLTTPSANYPAISAAGVPATVSIAFDNSLGSFSPYAGKMYLAYTSVTLNNANPPQVTETNIAIARGSISAAGKLSFGKAVQVNDDSASDNFTEGNRPQFIPAVAVDATTGTVVATWYDARLDANGTRAASFIATSIDGGGTWSNQTITVTQSAAGQTSGSTSTIQPFLDQPKNAIDIITGTTYTLQPVPSNIPLANQGAGYGIGIRRSVIASGGKIYAYWAGNPNSIGTSIESATAETAAGPRIVSSDIGPVLASSTVSGLVPNATGTVYTSTTTAYNTSVAADGTQGIDGFVVTFDRPLDPTQFVGLTSAQLSAIFQVKYHNPYNALGTDTTIPVTSVTMFFPSNPLTSQPTSTSLLIKFASQFNVGTYSYAVQPNIRDRIRTVVGGVTVLGNTMDQNANSSTGEANVDAYAMPAPTGGVPFTAPYDVSTQPLIIPGPHMTGTSSVNANGGTTGGGSTLDADLVLSGIATSVDLTFDRAIDPTTFKPGNIIRFTGPAGAIYDKATSATNPLTVTALSSTQFRIGFPGQVLSGYYTIEIDSQIAATATLGAGRPEQLDTNLNAGLDVLRGGSPTNGVSVDSSYSATFPGSAGTIAPAAGTLPATTEFPLNVPDSYLISAQPGHQVQVLLNIADTVADSQSVTDLIVELVDPAGKTIRLIKNAGSTTRPQSTVWFSSTILTDTANTPIQSGFQPFSAGPYNPQFPLSDLNGEQANGTWKLRIINGGTKTPSLTSWGLTLPQVKSGTGLGEVNADRIMVPFRIFNQNPVDPLTQDVWTSVGPTPDFDTDPTQNIENAGPTSALAVDPSDPSGNTVYLGATAGGLWKTTNFLTQAAGGPTWVPLIDSGPTYSLNVESIAVFPRNNDPSQSVIFAITGNGSGVPYNSLTQTGTPGVGILRSLDGGKTWVVLDSLNNVQTGTETSPGYDGTISSITASSRDRTFFNKTGFKIIIDPTAVNDTEQNLIVYAAFGTNSAGGTGGVYRSVDTGRHWTLVQAGDATDITLAAGSAAINTGNLQILYAAFRGSGVYIAQPAYAATGPNGMTLLTGSPAGNGNFIDGDQNSQPRIQYPNGSNPPNGANDRILLAAPVLTADAIENLNYQGWLYAAVVSNTGSFNGLFLTKDFGQNWTKVNLPGVTINGDTFGTNNYTQRTPRDMMGSRGKTDAALAIDPLNPNVVYIGGSNMVTSGPNGQGSGGFIRVDTTGVLDALAYVAYDNAAAGNNAVQFSQNSGNVVTKGAGTSSQAGSVTSPLAPVALGPGTAYGYSNGPNDTNTGYLNVLRDPNNPFSAASPQYFRNVSQIQNLGTGARYTAMFPEVNSNIHRIITFVDQTTGLTRLIVGDDEGVASAVDDGSGNILSQLGSGTQAVALPSLIRSGNLGISQFYSSTAQPGQLAAEIAQAMFYGTSRFIGFPTTGTAILQTGSGSPDPTKVEWSGLGGLHAGSWGLTDPTGSGAFYQYEWPSVDATSDANQYFTVNGVGRTLFLTQPTDNPTQGTGNWPSQDGPKFAVNPVDSQGLAISSKATGKFFRSVDQGRTWFQVTGTGVPTDYAQAIAFGSPDIGASNSNQFNNFIYAGHGSSIAVTTDGGTSWTDISGGLPSGSGAIQQIVPDTVRGSKAVYVVTANKVLFRADSTNAASPWVDITGNLLTLSGPLFNESNLGAQTAGSEPSLLRTLTALAVDWRYAIPDNSAGAPSGTFPVLYVGGYGGVFRSVDRGKTWQIYPQGTTYSYTDPSTGLASSLAIPDGGYLPRTTITQMTLSQGNIDPATGQPLQQTGGLNMLTVATYGRGTYMIRLGTPENDPAIAAIAKYQVVKQSGPQVIGVDVVSQPNTGSNTGTLDIEFNSPVLASTLTTGQVQITDANGQVLTVTGVTPIVNSTAPANYPSIPGAPTDYHNLYAVTFTAANPVATGFANVVIGTKITDYAGFGLNQDDDFTNGETTADPNNGGQAADAYQGSLYLYGSANPTGPSGNLHINMPVTTVAGAPTRVVISDLDPNTGLPNTGYTGTISLNATINGQAVVLSSEPVVQILNLSESGTTVTAKTVGPVAFSAGQTVRVAGVGTAGYNGDVVVTGVTATGFTYTASKAKLAADTVGGYVSGPEAPAAALSGTPAPVPSNPFPTTYTFTAADAGSHVFTVFYPVASGPATGQTLLSVADISSPPASAPNPAQAFVTVTAGTADHFVLSGPNTPVTAGANNSVTVSAVDSFGNVDTNYAGTVTFTSTDPNTAASVPSSYTFSGGTAGDAGVHTFTGLVFATATDLTNSYQTVTVTDATSPFITLTGSQNVFVKPDVASKFTVSGFPNSVAGVAGTFTVKAMDKYGNQASGYAGTVAFSTGADDLQASFAPATYTFTTGDLGFHSFTNGATLTKAGNNRTITATDTVNGITGTQSNIVISPAATSQLVLSGFPTKTTAGVAGTFVVAAEDQYGNTTPAYNGTVKLTTDNPLGSFVASTYKFTVADAGTHTFKNGVSLNKAGGPFSLTATDSVTSTITGSETGITVVAAAASSLTVSGFPNSVAGTAGSFTVKAFDPFGNVATGYTGTVKFSTGADDLQASFAPASYTFTAADAGIHPFTNGATLTKAGTNRTLTTTDTVQAALTATQSNIVITAAPTSRLIVGGFPASVTAGVAGTFSVTATDPYGNLTPAYAGTVNLTTDNPLGSFSPASYTFVPGTDSGAHTFKNGATLDKAGGPFSITATDGATATVTGTQTGITVTAAAAASLTVSGFPNSVAGVAGSYTVKAFDPFGNLATGYTGTVTPSSDDPQATFAPVSYAFTAGDAGAHTFANGATLRTAGTKSLTVTDAALAMPTATQANITISPTATSKFVLTDLPSPVAPGSPSPLTITAFDKFGNQTPAYTGTVALSSTDKEARFSPPTVTFTAANAGTQTLPGEVWFRRAGTQTVTATDTTTGASGAITVTVSVPLAVGFRVDGVPALSVVGSPQPLTVTAIDVFGDPVPAYTGTVAFTSSDPAATLPPPLTFAAAGHGVATTSVTLNTVGNPSVTLTDTTNNAVTTTVPFQVVPRGVVPSKLVVSVAPTAAAAGFNRTVTVTVVDDSGTVVPGYTGTVAFTSTDPKATLPAAVTLTNGVGVFNVVLRTAGSQTVTATDTAKASITGSQVVTGGAPVTPSGTLAVGSNDGDVVTVLDKTGATVTSFQPFPGVTGGVRVATGDVTGDGIDDYVVGTGPGGSTHVVVYDGATDAPVFSYDPFEPTFTGGVFVATGDVNGDGIADIAITPDEGGGPRVIVLQGGPQLVKAGAGVAPMANYFGIDDVNFRGGARAAIGDVNGDGFADVVVGAGFGGGPRVSVDDGKALSQGRVQTLFNDFFIFGGSDIQNLRNGVYVAVGDLNGDGFGDVIAGGGPLGGPRVLAVDGRSLVQNNSANPITLTDFIVRNAQSDRGGVRVATKDLDGDKYADLIAGDGDNIGSTVIAFKGSTIVSGGFTNLFVDEVYPNDHSGVYVG